MFRAPALRLALAVALFASLAGCSDGLVNAECDLVVINDSACDIHVFVNGREAFTVKSNTDRTLDDIGPGRHVLEALDHRGNLIRRRTIELAPGEDFFWILDDC